jgi:tetratricopeptide (TPR) repeat protein
VLHRARAAERRERLPFAAADYRTVLSADPANPEAHLGLARIALAGGGDAAAAAEAQAALAAVPGLFEAHALLAAVAVARGDREQAVAQWELAVEASPRDRDARVALARLLSEAGDARGAVAQWRAAVDLQEDAPSFAALAEAARAAKDEKTELFAIERLSALDPSVAEWRRVAEIRMAAGDWDGAEKALRRALARDPRDPAANAGLGRAQLRRGDTMGAVESLRAAGNAGQADLAPLEKRLNLERVARPDVGKLQKTVQALVDRTYRARAAETSLAAGRIELRATVGPSGAASVVEVLEDTVHDTDVRACAYWNLRDAAYPKDRPGRFTFVFAFRR